VKRKCFLVILILLCVLFLTGCLEGDFYISFNLDGSADLEFTLLASSQLDMLGDTRQIFGTMEDDLERDGFTVEPLERGDMKGFQASRHVADPEELRDIRFLGDVEPPEIHIEEGLFTNKYSVDHTFSLAGVDIGRGNSDMLAMLDPDMTIRMEFPISPASHNADEVTEDGRTLIWNLDFEEANHMQVAVDVPDVLTIVMLILAIVIVIVVIIVFIKKMKARDQEV